MEKTKFQFSNVVVVNSDQIGVIVKTWKNSPTRKPGYHYEVYVRSENRILDYDESEIKHYIFNKELSEDEREWH